MPSLLAPAFALAGLVLAAVPLLVHIFNRRRFRVVEWAAMDFLREALERNRRVVELRDIALLVVRTLVILSFSLAMARPFFLLSGGRVESDQPVHVAAVIDNSLSMGYQTLEGTLLQKAVSRAESLIDRLPPGSRMSVLPLCGLPGGFSLDAHAIPDDARDALRSIRVVEGAGDAALAAELALQALERGRDLAAKRVVFIGDHQARNWPVGVLGSSLSGLPELQVVEVRGADSSNAWIESLTLAEGVADLETECHLVATVACAGAWAREGVEVTLSVSGVTSASRSVALAPGQRVEIEFEHRFRPVVRPGEPAFVPVTVSLSADRLPADDARHLVVPVVAGLPVVFVDEEGDREDPARNRYGETFLLRRLLVPVTSAEDRRRHLVRVRHARIGELDRPLLEDARVVVVAGVERPGSEVALLREFVSEGGQLAMWAGGSFDPRAWTDAAWLDGGGILPLPLLPEPVGRLPDAGGVDRAGFSLSFPTLVGEYFALAGEPRQLVEDLFSAPRFFRAIVPDTNEDVLRRLRAAEIERLAQIEPALDDVSTEEIALRTIPRVLARFDNGVPFLVEREIGNGRMLLFTSGVSPPWNTLAISDAVLLYDRVLRLLLERTLPRRNFVTGEPIVLPVSPRDREASVELVFPSGREEMVMVEALGGDAWGVVLRDLAVRGLYRVIARGGPLSSGGAGEKLWEIHLAVNGPAEESDLTPLRKSTLEERTGDPRPLWVGPGEPIRLEGAGTTGLRMWKWLAGIALVLLLVEMAMLFRPFAASGDRGP